MTDAKDSLTPSLNTEQQAWRKWWPRVMVVVAVITICGYSAFKYRIAEMDNLYRGTEPSTRIGLFHYLMGNYRAAAASFKTQQSMGNSAEAQKKFAGTRGLLEGDLDAAQREVDSMLARYAGNNAARVSLAQIALVRGDAANTLNIATANIKSHAYAPFNSHLIAGIAATRLKNYPVAATHFSAATRQGHRGTRDSVLILMLETFAELESAGTFNTEPALAAVMLRVLAFWDTKIISKATAYAYKAIKLDNRADEAWLVIGAAHFTNGRYDVALSATENAKLINPQNPDAPWLAAYVFAARGDLANEIPAVLSAFALAPHDEFIADDTMRVLSKKVGDYPKIAALGQAMLARNPASEGAETGAAPAGASARRHVWVAYAATSLGKHREAVTHYAAAHALSPFDADTALRLARSYLDAGDEASALDRAQAAIALNPRWNAGYALIGHLHSKRGNYAAAIAAYEAGFAKQRPTVDQLCNLCVNYLRDSRYADASGCIDAVVQLEPTNVLANRLRYEVKLNRDIELSEQKSKGAAK